ncbi:MAG: CoA transferase [Burkholderiales bacterium]|nr:CoA transferase [Burkholderiales bacterium]
MTTLSTENNGPLAGIKILDLTSVVMGPFATQILGDMGAEIIKVEPPAGDNMRWVGPMKNPGMGHIHMHLNRNKRSLVLDLKKPEGLAAIKLLIANADALIYNVRPQAMSRLGLGYEAVKAINPKLVYVGAYGFSERGTYAGKPAYDDLIQGAAGVPFLTLAQGSDVPRYAPVTLGDRSVGLQTVIATIGALFHAQRTGQGQAVGVTMFESLSQFVLGDHMGGKTFEPPLGDAGYARLIAPHRRPYGTRDGYLCVLIYNDKHWRNFFDAIGREDLKTDPRFCDHTSRAANIGDVYQFVADIMQTRTTAEWQVLLEKADIPNTPMHTMDSLIDDPHLNASGFFPMYEHPSEGTVRTTAPVGEWSETPLSIRRLAPQLGQHSREVLLEAGLSEEAIDAMVASGATGANA